MNAMLTLLVLWLLPLAGAVTLWAFGPQLRRAGGVIGSATVLLSFVLALVLFGPATASGGMHVTPLVTWGDGFSFGLLLDPLSFAWTLVICGIGGLIHVYSIGYLYADRAIARFFAYLNFFVFAMLTLVLSDNVVGLLVGWGLVGLASYFLIGFWFTRPAAVAAARKAFVINVVGDVGLMFGVFALFAATGSIAFADIFAKAPSFSPSLVFVACVALFVACAAKSAQVPLHTWLPDAMEGPTPVSALIHAATMVTAGVYLVARFAPLWDASPAARELVGVIGGLTALTGALLGIGQWDIKRILAYSTMSQIGYMIMGVGVGANQAGTLHFLTHAFFKAQLFLGAGLVIHELHDEQDIRKMGGLRTRMPFAFAAMTLGTLAIIGFPGLSGFFSKDAVIYETLALGHPLLYAVGVVTAGITAFYMFRMLFIAFFGTYRGDVPDAALGLAARAQAHHEDGGHDAHAPAWVMQAPVALLMVGTVLAGYLGLGGSSSPWWSFLAPLFRTDASSAAPLPELASTVIVLVVVAAGFALAYVRYGAPGFVANAVERLRVETVRMPAALANAFYVDAAYDVAFVRPARAIGSFFDRVLDPHVIDAVVRDFAVVAGVLGLAFRRVQTGLVRGYALTVVAGVAILLAWFALAGAGR